jgi:hypothetical protein
MLRRIVRERARPDPHAIAAVVLDKANLNRARVCCEALKRHVGDTVLRPGDPVNLPALIL